ncbi:MAG: CI repressor [Mesorhizobium sp.]|nr:MAG: CI repressor [Mesorhizobium sp.]
MADRPPKKTALERAIEACGTAQKLAALVGVSPQAVSQWDRIPVERVLTIEKITKIPRSTLRPDIYPPERRKRQVTAA